MPDSPLWMLLLIESVVLFYAAVAFVLMDAAVALSIVAGGTAGNVLGYVAIGRG